MFDFKPLQSKAYEYIKDMILSREMQFDFVYSETKIAADLQLSRTPVRDALNRLAFERYIDILPNRGFRLHRPTESDLRQAYHVRMMIEGYCASTVANDCTSGAARIVMLQMESALNSQAAQVNSGNPDLKQYWLADMEFHRATLSYLNISTLTTQFDSYVHNFMPQHLKTEYILPRNRDTLGEHRAIIDAIASGNSTATINAIRRHLDASLEICLNGFMPESTSV